MANSERTLYSRTMVCHSNIVTHTKAGAMALLFTVRSAYANFRGLSEFDALFIVVVDVTNLENLATCGFDHCCSGCIGTASKPSVWKGYTRAWSWARGAQNGILRISLTVHRLLILILLLEWDMHCEMKVVRYINQDPQSNLGQCFQWLGFYEKKKQRGSLQCPASNAFLYCSPIVQKWWQTLYRSTEKTGMINFSVYLGEVR